jgi:hypothetical protein
MRQERDSMEAFHAANGFKRQEDDFPSCLCSNDTLSMEAIIGRSRKDPSLSPGGYPVAEDIIAILSAIPSSIVIYLSVHHNSFLASVGQLTSVVAVGIGSITALHFEAWRSRKI